MVDRVDTAFVWLWGERVGAVSWDDRRSVASFEFDPAFAAHGWDVSPLTMPVRRGGVFTFPALVRTSFQGLPGLLADSLPDRFGNALIDAWLARQGRRLEEFSPVERLCTIGARSTGALEFTPALRAGLGESVPVEVEALVSLAQDLSERKSQLDTTAKDDGLLDILRVGTSAGGMRPKAVVALNEHTGRLRSGQVAAPEGYSQWILKFDGVKNTSFGDPQGYGRIEHAYANMARAAAIEMPETRLLEENDRAHFMVRRFDRPGAGEKLHMLSLCALAHLDYHEAGAHSYEQAFQALRELRAPYPDWEQLYRRMVFNVLARNQDDHTKNIAFLMDRDGEWRLSPAYDLTFAFNPDGRWTQQHQMTIAGKREDFEAVDLTRTGEEMGIRHPQEILDEIAAAVAGWPKYAADAGVDPAIAAEIAQTHRRLSSQEFG